MNPAVASAVDAIAEQWHLTQDMAYRRYVRETGYAPPRHKPTPIDARCPQCRKESLVDTGRRTETQQEAHCLKCNWTGMVAL